MIWFWFEVSYNRTVFSQIMLTQFTYLPSRLKYYHMAVWVWQKKKYLCFSIDGVFSALWLICYQMLLWVLIKEVHSKCLQTEGGVETKNEAKAYDDEETCSSNSVRTHRGKSSTCLCEPHSVSVPKTSGDHSFHTKYWDISILFFFF